MVRSLAVGGRELLGLPADLYERQSVVGMGHD